MSTSPSDPPSFARALDRAGAFARGAFGRDLLGRFLPLSLALHLVWALPWAAVLAALLKLLGVQAGDVHWKDVDAPTVIPLDLDLEEGATEPPPATQTPGGDPAAGPSADAGRTDAANDGGLDAAVEASVDAAGDAAEPKGDAKGDAPSSDAGGETGDAGGGPPRVKDPNALAGGLAALKPPNKEVHVSVLVRMDHLRTHPIGKQLGSRLLRIEQWRPFFEGTDLDPVRDFDALFAFGPRFYETSRVSAIVAHNKADLAMTLVLQGVSARLHGEWIGDDDVPAFRAKIDGAQRVVVQLPGGLIVTPPDGEKQSIDLARQLVKKKKKVGAALPKGEPDLVVSAFLSKPSNVLTAIPDDLRDVHVTIRTRKDNGGVLDLEAKAKDPKTAEADVVALRALVESFVPKGFIGVVARKYVDGYTLTATEGVVFLHHELDGDRVESVWGLLTAGGL